MSYFSVKAPESAILYNKHVMENLNEIAHPLYECFGIQLLTYRRFFNNGDLLHLSNSPCWLDHSNTYNHWTSYRTLQRIQETPTQGYKTFIWSETPDPQDSVYGALYEFDLWNGATVYEKNGSSTEVWAFSGKKDNPLIQDIYLNNFSIIKRFILYFQDKAKEILDTTDRSKIITGHPKLVDTPDAGENEAIDSFIKKTQITRYALKSSEKDIYLSKREAQCIFHLSHGKGVKEIGQLLCLSPRTVEFYVNNLKEKTGDVSKQALLKKYLPTIHNWIF